MAQTIKIPLPGTRRKRTEIEEKSPDYEARAQRFRFLRDAVEGGGGFEDFLGLYKSADGERTENLPDYTYLKRHPRENDARWTRRRETAYYPNLISWIMGVALGLLTRETPGRENYPEQLTKWMDSARFENARALLFWWCLGYGENYALVDRARRGDASSAAAVGDSGAYIRMIHPDRVWDSEVGDDSQLLWLKYAADISRQPDPTKPREIGEIVWILTRDGWWNYELWEGDKEESEVPVAASGLWEGKVAGRVPVAVFRSRDDTVGGSKIAPAFIFAPARIMRRLYNVLSHKAQTQDSSCVPYFIIPAKDADAMKKMRIGNSSAIPMDPQGNKAPHFAVYDTGPAEHMATEAERLILLMKEVVSLAFDEDGAATGIAKSYAFLQLNVTLASTVTALEEFELDVLDLVERFEGRAGMPDGAKVGMSKKFDLTDAKADIEQGILLLTAELGPKGRREVKRKMLITRYLQDLDSERKADLELELEEEGEGADGDDTGGDGDPSTDPDLQPPTTTQPDPKLKPEQTEPR